ncbi:MAG: phospho-N-acetylmuramoyl-pentapeptide-transferase [Acidobacteria bacterium]|nr:phospho-N-acetylmuramoyl-pentapeptide-transferase [Acidobacteriota bacterium]
MLYWLLFETLQPVFGPLRLFGYVTFRTAFALITALLISLLLGPWMIRKLREMSIGQFIREDGPQSHQTKAGTPTMGGLLIVISILVPTLLWANLRNVYIWIAMGSLVGFGAIGFYDDYTKMKKMRNLGLTARQKFALQVLVAMAIGFVLLLMNAKGQYTTAMNVPFFKAFKPDLVIDAFAHNPWTFAIAFAPFYFFMVLVLVGSTNAVNLTDGLDGLAIGLMIIASSAMTALCYLAGHREFATYLELQRVPGSSELTIFCATMIGASLGFLWYNAHPAEVFMGDVGSLALGGSMGTVAVLIKQELLLPFIGGVYVMELLSVVIQVGSYKLRGKRVFKMAPIHHHFELLGWKESKVIARFWIMGLIMALFALATLKLR